MISVSIVMPGFDRAQYPDLTLASLARQSFGDFEIVLVNHGAADHTDVVRRPVHGLHVLDLFADVPVMENGRIEHWRARREKLTRPRAGARMP